MIIMFRIGMAAALVASMLVAVPASATTSTACSSDGWLGAWRAQPGGAQRFLQEDANDPLANFAVYPLALPRKISDQTLRIITTPLTSGDTARLRFSNKYGKDAVTFHNVFAGKQQSGAELVWGTNTPVYFNGADSVRVAPGQEVVTDPFPISVRPFDKIAVSFHIPEKLNSPPTYHFDGNHTSYLSPTGSGNHAGNLVGTQFTEQTTSSYYVTGIDVRGTTPALVVLGDSFTESVATTVDADRRWPDVLTRRLQAEGSPVSVVSSAISFNFASRGIRPTVLGPTLAGIGGAAGPDRFQSDVVDVPGAKAVVVLLGMNDLGFFGSAEQVIAAYKELAAKAHAAGLKIIGGTLTPTAGAPLAEATYSLPTALKGREKVNRFIRTSGLFDEVIDFAAAVEDPARPGHWKAGYSPDNVHPGDKGAQAEGEAIDLAMINRVTRCG
ncbi:hypothetical protein D5S17_24810 [Pseudonocardiaceae bacterium YIM PH 21723]|nr:hypothetical protein D5S17_24810 [Pseudonocardiaceae bacterium YIM PH 21723]